MNLIEAIPTELLLIIIGNLSPKDLINLYLTNSLYYGKYITSKELRLDPSASLTAIINSAIMEAYSKHYYKILLNHIKSGGNIEVYDKRILETNNVIRDMLRDGFFNGSIKNITHFTIFSNGMVIHTELKNINYRTYDLPILKYLAENDIQLELK
jgi:hypothetical protein